MSHDYTKNWDKILNAAIYGLKLKCPSCGGSRIYNSILKLKPNNQCSNCGLKFEDFDTGDGPAYTAIFFISFLIPIIAIIIEIYYEPSLWVHAAITIPLTLLFTYIILIFSRSVFIAIEHKIRQLEKEEDN